MCIKARKLSIVALDEIRVRHLSNLEYYFIDVLCSA